MSEPNLFVVIFELAIALIVIAIVGALSLFYGLYRIFT